MGALNRERRKVLFEIDAAKFNCKKNIQRAIRVLQGTTILMVHLQSRNTSVHTHGIDRWTSVLLQKCN